MQTEARVREAIHGHGHQDMGFPRHSLLTKLALASLTGNIALSIYRSRDDPRAVAFGAASYVGILLLLHFLRKLMRGEGDVGRTKAAVWALITLLSALFAAAVGPLMQPAGAAVVYLTSAGTAASGFWALFLRRH